MQGSDRLFQLDLTAATPTGGWPKCSGKRRWSTTNAARGRHRRHRGATAARDGRRDRAAIAAFSDGVNAAAEDAAFAGRVSDAALPSGSWTPKDSLAVSVVASLELADPWHDIFTRERLGGGAGRAVSTRLFPLSDARYDVTVDGARDESRARRPRLRRAQLAARAAARDRQQRMGSGRRAAPTGTR